MQITKLYILPLLLCCATLHAQLSVSPCEAIYAEAVSLFEKGDYALAIKKVSVYKLCANTLQNKKADDLLLKVFETVNKQKQEAFDAKQQQEKLTAIAKEAAKKEKKARENAEDARKKEEAAKKEALAQRDTATQRLKIMVSRKLLTDASEVQNQSPPQWHLSMLLGQQALKMSPTASAEAVVRKALSKLPVLLQAHHYPTREVLGKLSPNGRYAAIGPYLYYNDDTTSIWDMQQCKKIFSLAESGPVFFTQQNYLVTGSKQKKVVVVDFALNKTICEFPHAKPYARVLAISPNDRYIITQTYGTAEGGLVDLDERIFVWDVVERKKINTIKPGSTVGPGYGQVFFFEYHGKLQIALNWGYGKTEVWNTNDPSAVDIPKLNGNTLARNGLYQMAYHPDKNGFQLWAIDNENPIISNNQLVKGYSFSPSNKYFLLFSERTIEMWDLETRRKLWEEPNFNSYVRNESICFSPNDRFFSLPLSNEIKSVKDGSAVAFNYWSETVDSTQVRLNNQIQNVATNKPMLKHPAHTLLLSQTGDTLVTASEDNKLLFWAIKPHTHGAAATLPQSPITALALGSKSGHVYVGGYDGVYKFDGATLLMDTLAQTQRNVMSVAVDKNERLLAYGLEYETLQKEKPGVYIIDWATAKKTHIPIDASILSLQFNKSGTLLLAGTAVGSSFRSCDCGLWLIDLRNNTKTKIDSASAGISYYRAQFIGDGNLVLFTSGFEAKLIDIDLKKTMLTTEFGRHMLYSDKFKTLVKSKQDVASVYLTNIATGNISLKTTRQFTGEIISLRLSETAPLALIGVKEGYGKSRLVVWDYSTQQDVHNFEIEGNIAFADFSTADAQKVVVCYDDVVALYDLSYKSIQALCKQKEMRELSPAELKYFIGTEFDLSMFK
jgi:WD40 repeat protein